MNKKKYPDKDDFHYEIIETAKKNGMDKKGTLLMHKRIKEFENCIVEEERERCAIKYASSERIPTAQAQRVLNAEIQKHYFKPQVNDNDFCELCNDNFRSETHVSG